MVNLFANEGAIGERIRWHYQEFQLWAWWLDIYAEKCGPEHVMTIIARDKCRIHGRAFVALEDGREGMM